MFSVRRLIAIFALVLAGLPFQASATVLNGMRVLWQIDTARTVLDNALLGCPDITNDTLRSECIEDARDLRHRIETWESEFSAGTLTVDFDAATEQAIYNDEVALKNVASAAGYTVSSAAINSATSPLELAPDELRPEGAAVSDCSTCWATVGTISVACLKYIPGLWKLACVVGGFGGIVYCGSTAACNPPPDPPRACST